MTNGLTFAIFVASLCIGNIVDGGGKCAPPLRISFKNINRTPDQTIINTTHTGISLQKCISVCNKEERSPSLYFMKESLTCHCNKGTDTRTGSGGKGTITYGYVHNPEGLPYNMKHLHGSLWTKPLSTIGEPCATPADCMTKHSRCLQSICRCKAGYSYNPTNDSCLTFCAQYGSTFHLDANHAFRAKDLGTFRGISEEACKARCVAEKGFVCRLAEYGKYICYLSNETAFTKPNAFQTRMGVNVHHRNCA